MKVLAIESTCDETAAAVVQGDISGIQVLSNVVASSADMHIKYGGIVPEVAAREQVNSIIPVIREAIEMGGSDFEAIAVSYGPGLMGSLLTGVETAKALAYVWKKPLIGVDHMVGHVAANWIQEEPGGIAPKFPALGIVVSGGHTDLLLLKSTDNWKWVGGTRDDAVGEAFDKAARILGLPYPGGPSIQKAIDSLEKNSVIKKEWKLPRPMINDDSLEMSFSGLKAALNKLVKENQPLMDIDKAMLAKEFNEAIVDVLIKKSLKAVELYQPKSVLLAGGVAANKLLRERLQSELDGYINLNLFIPQFKYCGDNAAMVGAAAILRPQEVVLAELKPEPGLATD